MDIPAAVLLGLAFIWFVLQEFTGPGARPVPRGVPVISALILAAIVAIDWFAGRRAILGHPGSFFHTLFKLVLLIVIVVLLGSGLTAIRFSMNIKAAILNLLLDVALLVLFLRLLGAWSFSN